MKNERFIALVGLRGAGALVVLAYHIGHAAHVYAPFTYGHYIVDFFFILSGFVLTQSYEAKLQSGTLPFWRYAKLRLTRFYPLIAAGALIGATQIHFFPLPRELNLPLALALQLLFIPEITTPNVFMTNYVQWSLFFEFFVNFVHARFVQLLRWPLLLGALVAGSAALLFAATHWVDVRVMGPGGGWPFLAGFPRCMFAYFLGVALYRLRRAGHWPTIDPRFAGPVFAIMFAVFMVLLCAPLPLFPFSRQITLAGIVMIFCPLMMVSATQVKLSPRIEKIADVLAAASFPLYCIHLPIVFTAARFLDPASVPLAVKLIGWTAVASGCFVLALGVEALDQHIRAALKRRNAKPRRPAPDAFGEAVSAD